MNVKKKNSIDATMSLWLRYKFFVADVTTESRDLQEENIKYWREMLFTKFITYLLPTCLIALVPGVFMAFKGGFLFIACSDIFAAVSIGVVALNGRLGLLFRKAFVIAILYLLSIALLIHLSLLGPGMVYLLALSVVITVIFPRLWGYWSVVANFLICVFCALIIHFNLFHSPLVKDYDLGTWIAVSSNMLFLSFVIVMLVGNAIKGFENVISKELLAKSRLQKELEGRAYTNALLAESESHYKSLFFQNPSPMWVLDRESLQFLQVNESAIKQYGYTNEEFLSMNIKDIKMGKDVQTLYDDLNQNKVTGAPLTLVTKHRRKDQEQFFAEVTFNTISFKAKPAILVISQDITEQVNYLHSIESQNEKFNEIARIQSHNVRGPLATILGLTQLFIDKEMVINTEEIVHGILQSSRQLDAVIREIVHKTSIAQVQVIPANRTTKGSICR